MISGSQFRHDSAVFPVKVDLAEQLICDDTLGLTVNRDSGLITGSFYAEYVQCRSSGFSEAVYY